MDSNDWDATLDPDPFSTYVVKSLFSLARYFSVVWFGPLSTGAWGPSKNIRTCTSCLVPAKPG